jgi:hypothetical protein
LGLSWAVLQSRVRRFDSDPSLQFSQRLRRHGRVARGVLGHPGDSKKRGRRDGPNQSVHRHIGSYSRHIPQADKKIPAQGGGKFLLQTRRFGYRMFFLCHSIEPSSPRTISTARVSSSASCLLCGGHTRGADRLRVDATVTCCGDPVGAVSGSGGVPVFHAPAWRTLYP